MYLASGSIDETIKIWNLQSKENIKTLTGHFGAVTCLLYMKNIGIISGSRDRKIKIWNENEEFNNINTFSEHSDTVSALIELNDERFASASYDKTLIIWNKHGLIRKLQEHTDKVTCLENLNQDKLISGSLDHKIIIWDKNEYTIFQKIDYSANSNIDLNRIELLLKLNYDSFISCSQDNKICIWKFNHKSNEFILEQNNSYFPRIAKIKCMSNISNLFLAAGLFDSSIKIMNVKGNIIFKTLSSHQSTVNDLI